MKYPDGTDAHVGDRVRVSNGDTGVIVFSVDTNEYTAEYPKEDWAYLGSGVMVQTDIGALVHFGHDSNTHLVAKIG